MPAMRCFMVTAMLSLALAGCGAVANPSFPLTVSDANSELERMREDPKPLARPVVVLGGYHDPGLGAVVWEREVRRWSRDAPVIDVSFALHRDFDQCRRPGKNNRRMAAPLVILHRKARPCNSG